MALAFLAAGAHDQDRELYRQILGLSAGNPPIQLGRVSGTGDRGMLISVPTLQPGEEQQVADRLRAILSRP